MSSLGRLNAFAETKLQVLQESGQRRSLIATARASQAGATRHGKSLISFCDNDYLGLSCDKRLVAAASLAAEKYGVGAGASRLVAGNCPLNDRLEAQLADMKSMAACRVFGSGYLANVGAIPALVGRGDTIILDELSHACMHAGAALSGARIEVFRHNDTDHVRELLIQAKGQVLVLTETVFSMDGDRAPLTALHRLCEEFEAWLMTDDAHGFGIIHDTNPAHIQMGTLSKAAGVYGGYVCGPAPVIELLISRARSFVYTTGLPPPVLGAAIAALEIMQSEPQRSQRANDNAALFCQLMDLPAPQSVIVPLIIGAEAKALAMSEALQEAGFLITAIRPPTVPEGTSRLRLTFTTAHDESDVRRLAAAIKNVQQA